MYCILKVNNYYYFIQLIIDVIIEIINTWNATSSTGRSWLYFNLNVFVKISYNLTVESHDATKINCAEFGPNSTADIASVGGFFILNSVLDSIF